ncbi:MAG: Crp/Fnr family transcriptional regulator [Tenericutes bacterium]|nr:Crp/Fnr family transcriptional regulator [Mycoplasmatota bacterium]
MIYNNKELMSHFSIKCYYSKGMTVYQENDLCDRIGFVHTGKLKLTHFTCSGEERVLAILNENDIFGDFLINSLHPYFPGTLVAIEDTEISFLDKYSINSLIKNNDDFRIYYLNQLSEKSLELNFHNKILMQCSLREKILMWLDHESIEKKSKIISIHSKEQLANYFNVARPSLSRELSEMKKNGLIDYDLNCIQILY